MNDFTSKRIATLKQSEIRNMTRECERVGGINLGQGLGDLATPPLVRDGAIQAIQDGKSTYSYSEGILELREAIAEKLLCDNGIHADPGTDIVVTLGATGAFAAALMGLLNPGDGVLLLEPYYGYHLGAVVLSGNEPQFLTLEPPDFALKETELRAALCPNTRAIVMCTPSNPSGKMFTETELSILDRVAREKDLLVITDEIYEYLVYDGRKHLSPAAVGKLRERTVTIMGFSKTFSITGWRLGYAVAPAPLAQAINLVNDLFYVCAPTPLQYGAACGLKAPPQFFSQLKADYQRKRDIICEGLAASGLTPLIPQGAYYVLADISHLGYPSAKAAAMALLEQTRVASVPATAFYQGSTGEGMLRFCFAKDDITLREAAQRLRSFRPKPVRTPARSSVER